MNKFKLLLVALMILIIGGKVSFAQVDQTVIWVQDFDDRWLDPSYALDLNLPLPSEGDKGNNEWVRNAVYNGSPTTPSQYLKEGGLGQISNANGNYLHISSDNTNAHFDPSSASTKSTSMPTGLCTYGYSQIRVAFWWTAGGNSTSYGQVKYSIDGGINWHTTTNGDGDTAYYGQSIWKYTQIEDLRFINHNDLRIAFVWNNNGTSADLMSWAIDDIVIIGEWDVNAPTVEINAQFFTPNPVCHEFYGSSAYYFSVTDSLCPGTYVIQVSDSNGDFTNAQNLWQFTAGALYTGTTWYVGGNLPFQSDLLPAKCYKFRIRRVTPPVITGTASVCFEIKDDCPDTVAVFDPPAVTQDPDYDPSNPANPPGLPPGQQPVCNCSAIDVSFYSFGAFNPGNTYSLELSDSSGSFDNPTVFGGPQASTRTWDPAAPWMPPPPGSISGQMPCDTTKAPPGCNYYLRVVSSDTTDVFIPWGPFCIKKCDVMANKTIDISCCITYDHGWDTLIPIDINTWDPSIFYNLGNEFKVQLCDPGSPPPMPPLPPMTIVSTGDIGISVDTTSGLMFLSIPDLNGWTALGLYLKMYYMRIISTDGSDVTDVLGSLIRLTVDGISGKPLAIIIDPDSVGCNKPENVTFTAIPPPFPATSQFIWTFDGYVNNPLPSNVFVFSGGLDNGWHTMTVREIGPAGVCLGPTSDVDSFEVVGPKVKIIGDLKVCMGDTVTYSVEFFDGTYYEWSFTGGGILIDSSNNQITIYWPPSPFPYSGTISLLAIMENFCTGYNSEPVSITSKTEANVFVPDTAICSGATVTLVADNLTSSFFNTFNWTVEGSTISLGDSSILFLQPDTTSSYVVMIDHDGCKDWDTVQVEVVGVNLEEMDTAICDIALDSILLDVWFNIDHATSYHWEPPVGLSDANVPNPMAKPSETTTYTFYAEFDVCDPDTAMTTITVFPTKFAIGPPAEVLLILGQKATLHASGGIFYSWSPATGLSDTSVANPIASPDETTLYTVTITDRNGCEKTGEVLVKVIERPTLFLPNAFSPNGDGENDKFFVIDLGIEDLLEFRIFNRWGELIFETSDINEGWDGTYRGKEQEMGTYIYYVRAETMQYRDVKEIVELQGDVTLVR